MNKHLFLYGGGLPFLPRMTKTFAELALKKDGPISIVFLARDGWQQYMNIVTEALKDNGLRRFTYIPLQITAIDEAVDTIRNSSGIVVLGGDTNGYADYIVDTPLSIAIKESVNNGIPYVGFSAGALISTEICIISAKDNDENEFQERKGLGLLPNTGLAVHFSEWNDEEHLMEIERRYPRFSNYGIDEQTGIYFLNGKVEWIEGKGVYKTDKEKIVKIYG